MSNTEYKHTLLPTSESKSDEILTILLEHKKSTADGLITEPLTRVRSEQIRVTKTPELIKLMSVVEDITEIDEFSDLIPIAMKMMMSVAHFRHLKGTEKKKIVIDAITLFIKESNMTELAKIPLIILVRTLLPSIIDALFQANQGFYVFKQKTKKCLLSCIS